MVILKVNLIFLEILGNEINDKKFRFHKKINGLMHDMDNVGEEYGLIYFKLLNLKTLMKECLMLDRFLRLAMEIQPGGYTRLPVVIV